MIRLGRTVGTQLVDAVSSRIDGGGPSHVTVAGMRLTGGAGPEEPDDADALGLPEWTASETLDARRRAR